jgi:hypothetical protein
MKVIRKNIKVYERDGAIIIGESKLMGYIISIKDKYSIGEILTCHTTELLEDKIDIKIDYKNIFLTRDNLIIFKSTAGGMYNEAIDLKKKVVYSCSPKEINKLLTNLSDRTHITLKNS